MCQSLRINAPDVVLLAVHEGHRNLVGESASQLRIQVDVLGLPGNASRGAHLRHHLKGHLTQMTILPDEEEHTRFSHAQHSRRS